MQFCLGSDSVCLATLPPIMRRRARRGDIGASDTPRQVAQQILNRRTEKSPEKFVAPFQGIYAQMQKQDG